MSKKIVTELKETVASLDATVSGAVEETDKMVDPLRKSAFRRFPTLFMFLVTVGVTATFLGIEKLIASIAYLDTHPLVLLIVGVAILFVTGTLYKKLG